ncbi:MAG: hypothetical protein AB8G86_14330 [Saprospiraceae bacterium]
MFNSSIINLQKLQQQFFSVAYRMIGEKAASEDIVQETITIYWTKLKQQELTHIQDLQKSLALHPLPTVYINWQRM